MSTKEEIKKAKSYFNTKVPLKELVGNENILPEKSDEVEKLKKEIIKRDNKIEVLKKSNELLSSMIEKNDDVTDMKKIIGYIKNGQSLHEKNYLEPIYKEIKEVKIENDYSNHFEKINKMLLGIMESMPNFDFSKFADKEEIEEVRTEMSKIKSKGRGGSMYPEWKEASSTLGTLTGVLDGNNQKYTLPDRARTGTLNIFYNGVRQNKGQYTTSPTSGWVDSFTFTQIQPIITDTVEAFYAI